MAFSSTDPKHLLLLWQYPSTLLQDPCTWSLCLKQDSYGPKSCPNSIPDRQPGSLAVTKTFSHRYQKVSQLNFFSLFWAWGGVISQKQNNESWPWDLHWILDKARTISSWAEASKTHISAFLLMWICWGRNFKIQNLGKVVWFSGKPLWFTTLWLNQHKVWIKTKSPFAYESDLEALQLPSNHLLLITIWFYHWKEQASIARPSAAPKSKQRGSWWPWCLTQFGLSVFFRDSFKWSWFFFQVKSSQISFWRILPPHLIFFKYNLFAKKLRTSTAKLHKA